MMGELIDLSYKERGELERLLALRIESRQYQRALTLLLIDEGSSVEEIAEQLRVSRQTVYNWIERFEQRRELSPIERVLDATRSGRPVTASGVIDPLIDEIIDDDPRDYGYNSTVWTADLLRQYLSKHHKVDVGMRSIGYALSRLRIRWKRPRHVLARQELFWRQAKGGLNAASGRRNVQSC
jgi:transposase